jgi:hypothetical protein
LGYQFTSLDVGAMPFSATDSRTEIKEHSAPAASVDLKIARSLVLCLSIGKVSEGLGALRFGLSNMLRLDCYLRIKDAAEYLGVSPNTLRNWGRAGQIAEHRHPVNNYRLYLRSDLNLLLKHAQKPRPK